MERERRFSISLGVAAAADSSPAAASAVAVVAGASASETVDDPPSAPPSVSMMNAVHFLICDWLELVGTDLPPTEARRI